ncbi:MAG: type II toxin-antitoxin system RelE/ParE family toxin [SAR324 cluster bacterium]|nr:type II toxin-antitoxin system RelE/ParE family toxin [SAR324 cluster bacterium]
MNQHYEVLWAEIAEQDLRRILDYIAVDHLSTALKLLKQIKEKTNNLYLHPERGRIVPELQDQGIFQYRELVVSRWRIIYRVSEKDVYILAVIDSRLNVEDILLERFVKSVH